jgi:hypothetical protein
MSNHRPTTLERAYELARGGGCRTVGEIKQALQSEGFERIQDPVRPTPDAAPQALPEHYIATPDGEVAE